MPFQHLSLYRFVFHFSNPVKSCNEFPPLDLPCTVNGYWLSWKDYPRGRQKRECSTKNPTPCTCQGPNYRVWPTVPVMMPMDILRISSYSRVPSGWCPWIPSLRCHRIPSRRGLRTVNHAKHILFCVACTRSVGRHIGITFAVLRRRRSRRRMSHFFFGNSFLSCY